MQLKPVYPIQFAEQTYIVDIGLIALSANMVVSSLISWVLAIIGSKSRNTAPDSLG